MKGIDKVIKNDHCIGCGVCTLNKNFKIKFNSYGEYKAERIKITELHDFEDRICPFSDNAIDEDEISRIRFDENLNESKFIGKYIGVYAGFVEKSIRSKSSSGGGATLLASYLLTHKYVDEVYHVEPYRDSEKLFRFTKSQTDEEIKQRAKSRYYPVTFADVIKEMMKSDKKKLIIGLPCFIKAINLVEIEDPEKITNIKFKFAILCGHLKGKFFQQMLTKDMGLMDNQIEEVDFRHKQKDYPASDYFVRAKSIKTEKIKGPIKLFYGQDWGMGFFKYKACDYCDDVAGETADISFGDAWLPQYRNDYQGTNIIVTRNKILDDIIKKTFVKIDKLTEKDFVNSQLASFKHRRNGLRYRVKKNKNIKKRVSEVIQSDNNSEEIYLFRETIRDFSKKYYLLSKKLKCFYLFKILMYPLETWYFLLKTKSIKSVIPVTLKAKISHFLNKNL